jgi:transcriptional regulator with XRE-family HTH domain
MTTPPSPIVRRRRLGMELRDLREQAELTIEQVAGLLRWSSSKVSRIETGRITVSSEDVQRMLDIYGVRDKPKDALVKIAREAKAKAWWQRYRHQDIRPLIGFESAAASIRTFEAQAVPGLLQTEAYARAVLRASHPELPSKEIDRRVDLRMARQTHLFTVSEPPRLWAILDEPIVHRPVGGLQVMRMQLEELIRAAESPVITIQVLPLSSGEHAGMDGSFSIHSFSDSADPTVVYVGNAAKDDYLDEKIAIARYELIFDHLQAAALKPTDSIDFLATVAKAYADGDSAESGIRSPGLPRST